MNLEINWFWFFLVIGATACLMGIEEVLNRKGFEPDFWYLYWIIGAFFIFAFI